MKKAIRWAALAGVLATGTVAGCGVPPFGSPGDDVTVKPGQHGRTFGDVMHPMKTAAWESSELKVTSGAAPPSWGDMKRTRWNLPGAFTPSQQPRAIDSLRNATGGTTDAQGAAYPGTNGSLKNADVSFVITAKRFAIVYPGNEEVDAMVWVDSRPVAAEPIIAEGPPRTATPNWIAVSLPERKTVTVRFAGPLGFTGVDVPAADGPADIKATKPAVTLGVLSDSYYDLCMQALCMSRTAAPMLSTLTGFRVWNLAEVGTGYLNPGRVGLPGEKPSPFGSARRLAAVKSAPINALLVGGSINDALLPQQAYRATVDRLLNRVQQLRPGLPVVLLGVEPLGGVYQGTFWRKRGEAMTAVLRSMVTRHGNVVGFIDPFSKPWLSGTGSIDKPAGDGNDDRYIGSDGIHPSIAGTRYYQQKVVDALRRIPFPTSTTRPPFGS